MAKLNLLGQWLSQAESPDNLLDRNIKGFLANRVILAWILKNSVEEFKEFQISEIEDMIEGEIDISKVRLEPDTAKIFSEKNSERIAGMDGEDYEHNEGIVYFDIRFFVRYPKNGALIKLIINVEAQNKFDISIIKRAVVYCARMISAQIRQEFTPPDYGEVKKVISIWLCFNPPKYARDTITSFKIQQKNLYGNLPMEKLESDVMEVILICMAEEKRVKAEGKSQEEWICESQNKLIRMLGVALSKKLTSTEKMNMLESEYDIAMDSKMKAEVDDMCNYSEGIREEAREEVLAEVQAELDAKDAEIEAKDAEIEAKDAEIEAKDAEIEAKDVEIDAKNAVIRKNKAHTKRMEELLIAHNIPIPDDDEMT